MVQIVEEKVEEEEETVSKEKSEETKKPPPNEPKVKENENQAVWNTLQSALEESNRKKEEMQAKLRSISPMTAMPDIITIDPVIPKPQIIKIDPDISR